MKINTNNNCDIIIFDDTEYPINDLSYQDSVSLYVVQENKSSGIINLYTNLNNHQNSTGNPIKLQPKENGYITACHIVLPTNNSNKYWSDGTDIYKTIDGVTEKLENYQELLEMNNPPFYRQIQNFFSVCYLRKCYISLCQKIFNARGFERCFQNKINSQLIYKRDLVWAALNVIQYMIDSNQLAEAQRLLERINGCNGLCSSEDTGEKGCGCE